MQDYRAAVDKGDQAALDAWARAHPGGVKGDNGVTHRPETKLNKRAAVVNRMGRRQRSRFQNDVYETSGRALDTQGRRHETVVSVGDMRLL
jgi:hypothetical protein